jgi:hypothetical protein
MISRIAMLMVVVLSPSIVTADTPPASTFQSDLLLAQADAAGGILVRARAEGTNGSINGFYFYINGTMVEIEVRGNKVVKNTAKDKIPIAKDVIPLIEKMNKGKTKLPDGRLIEIAQEALKKAPIKDLEYKVVNGRLVIQVGDLVIDAETGKVVP